MAKTLQQIQLLKHELYLEQLARFTNTMNDYLLEYYPLPPWGDNPQLYVDVSSEIISSKITSYMQEPVFKAFEKKGWTITMLESTYQPKKRKREVLRFSFPSDDTIPPS